MRFWTIQPQAVWKKMERGDAVRVDPDHPRYRGRRPWQYEWLSSQLALHRPGFDGGWPWWLSCNRPTVDPSAKLPGGPDQACIELELPERRCAVFPLWMWETIHTGHYLALSREELDRWRVELRDAVPDPRAWPLPEPWQERRERSWLRLFDRSVDSRCWYRDAPPPADDAALCDLMTRASGGMAALTQELRAGDAVDVVLFTAAG